MNKYTINESDAFADYEPVEDFEGVVRFGGPGVLNETKLVYYITLHYKDGSEKKAMISPEAFGALKLQTGQT